LTERDLQPLSTDSITEDFTMFSNFCGNKSWYL